MKFLLLLCSAMCATHCAFAQLDTVSIKKDNLQTQFLKPQSNIYLNFSRDNKTGKASNFSLSKRTLFFKKLHGKEVIVVVQNKLNSDTSKNKLVYTISDRRTFKTLFDLYKSSTEVEAYDFKGDEVFSSDTVSGNMQHNFHLAFNEVPYCLELDLETVSALPLKHIRQKMAVCFYQPGRLDLPKFHKMEVIGQEKLKTAFGMLTDCWIVKLYIDKDDYDLFWIGKLKREFFKLESHSLTDTFIKVKLFNDNLNL